MTPIDWKAGMVVIGAGVVAYVLGLVIDAAGRWLANTRAGR